MKEATPSERILALARERKIIRPRDIGKIPTCDVIDLGGYARYWHTEQDTPAHCSPLALAKVGWVMLEWLKQVK